jgi:uncharacterized protein YciI
MKRINGFIILLSFLIPTGLVLSQTGNANYDSTLAASLGADDLGMKQYILVILKTGNAKIEGKAIRDSLFAGHFANIKRLSEQKKLVLAGPLSKNVQSYRGIFILDVKDSAGAAKMLEGDPAIGAGVFTAEYFNWYGSAALPLYLDEADKVWKTRPK